MDWVAPEARVAKAAVADQTLADLGGPGHQGSPGSPAGEALLVMSSIDRRSASSLNFALAIRTTV